MSCVAMTIANKVKQGRQLLCQRRKLKKQRAKLINSKTYRENVPQKVSTERVSRCSQNDYNRRKDRA